ncbi:MAG TPA: quinol:electron acceptor oxidoreductase subunit ActD, partial [Gammaproteobacteria bacterium]
AMKKNRILGLFSNFDEAFSAISEIRLHKVIGVSVDDVTVISPIEHPEIEEVLGERPSHVPKFALCGAIFGLVFGFLFLAVAQATFLIQPQGGKPVIALPTNIVLTYEMLILFSVLFTLAGFILGAHLLRRRKSPYSEKVSLDQVGIELEIDEKYVEPIKHLFRQHQALEIREEVMR